MSLFDWVNLGMSGDSAADKALDEAFTGAFDVTIGDVVYGVFGAEYDEFFGPYCMLVVDLEDMLLSNTLAKFLPVTSALLAGVGGNANFIYGTATNANYVGPSITIRRAASIDKSSDNVLARLAPAQPPAPGAPPVQDPVDVATVAAITALSVLAAATAAALDLAVHFAYPTYGSGTDGYQSTPKLLQELSTTIVSRSLALIQELEVKGGWAGLAEQMGKEAKFIGMCLGVFALACIPLFGWYAILVLKEEAQLGQAMSDAAAALSHH